MGLFSNFGMKAARAGALLNGDYGAAGQIHSQMAKAKEERAEKEAVHAQLAQLRSALKQEGLPDHAIDGILSNPKAVSELMVSRYKPWDNGPEGGSRLDPATGQTRLAPRFDGKGNYYGPSLDASAPPERLQRGIENVVVPQGGQNIPTDSITGQDMTGQPLPGGGGLFRGGMAQQADPNADLRAKAAEAIRNGADPAKVAQRLQQLLSQGGPSASPTGGFLGLPRPF